MTKERFTMLKEKILQSIIRTLPALIALIGASVMFYHFFSVSTGYDPGILYKGEEKFLALMLALAVTGAILGNKLNRPWEKGANIAIMAFFIFMIIGKWLQGLSGWVIFPMMIIGIPLSIPILIWVIRSDFKVVKEPVVTPVLPPVASDTSTPAPDAVELSGTVPPKPLEAPTIQPEKTLVDKGLDAVGNTIKAVLIIILGLPIVLFAILSLAELFN